MFRNMRNIGRVLSYCMLPKWLIIEYPLVPRSLRPRLFRHWFSFPEFVPSACLTGETKGKHFLSIYRHWWVLTDAYWMCADRYQFYTLINKKVLQHMPQHLKKAVIKTLSDLTSWSNLFSYFTTFFVFSASPGKSKVAKRSQRVSFLRICWILPSSWTKISWWRRRPL